MAAWDDLPGEVRNKIYRNLLVHANYVDPEAQRLGRAVKTHLQPAFLRVCKKIYNEAISILYEENLFRFDYPYSGYYMWNQSYLLFSDFYSSVNFEMIKKIEIHWNPRGHQHLCPNAEEIMQVIKRVKDLRCLLDTLRIMFSFHKTTLRHYTFDENFYGQPSPSHILRTNLLLSNTIANMKINKDIVVVIESDQQHDCINFEDVAVGIASLKEWAVTSRHQSEVAQTRMTSVAERIQEGGTSNDYIKAINDIDDVGFEDGSETASEEDGPDTDDDAQSIFSDFGSDGSYMRELHDEVLDYRWTWTIEPAAIDATDKVPQG